MGRTPMKYLLLQGHNLKDETNSVAVKVFCVLTESREALFIANMNM